jgi:hypothetical protein
MSCRTERFGLQSMLARTVSRSLWVSSCLVLSVQAAWSEEEKPLWELGLGMAVVSFPAYRGSDQNSTMLLPAPYFIYRGELFQS